MKRIAWNFLAMDSLMKALEKRAFTVRITGDHPVKTVVIVNDEEIEIGIDEKISRKDHEPTPEEIKKHSRYPWMIVGRNNLISSYSNS